MVRSVDRVPGTVHIAGSDPCGAEDEPMTDVFDRIEASLDGLRPYIESHRGHVEVIDFDEHDGLLTLRMGGACHGCSASTVTLRQGIEVRLRDTVPEVKRVESV